MTPSHGILLVALLPQQGWKGACASNSLAFQVLNLFVYRAAPVPVCGTSHSLSSIRPPYRSSDSPRGGGWLSVGRCGHHPRRNKLHIDAAIPFYGIPPGADPAAIRCPVQAHFAVHDDWCAPAKVDELETAMQRGGVRYELHRYEAHHAFMNATRPEVYDAACAALAWGRVIEFLGKL